MTQEAPGLARSKVSPSLVWLALLVPLGLGLAIGFDMGYRTSVPGNGFGALGGVIEGGALVIVLCVIGITALALRRWRIARLAFLSAVLVPIGIFGGFSLSGPLGLAYREPVVLQSAGPATIHLDSVAGFTANPSATTTCSSSGDSTVTETVTGLDLGELGAGTLRGSLTLQPTLTKGHIELFIDGADIPEGGVQPSWGADAALADLGTDALSGTATFGDLAYTDPNVQKGGPAPSGGGWPATLSGTLHWDCHP
jgi:hypothetical protein